MSIGGGIFKNWFKPKGSYTKINKRNYKDGKLVRVPKKVTKYKEPNWKDLTYRKVEIVPHEKNETRGKRVVTKTTYHGVRNPDNLSKRKLRKNIGENRPYNSATHVTQKKTTKYHDSRRWHDDVQDRKKKQVEYTTGRYDTNLHSDRDHEDKTTYRSKTKHLRANKEGKEIVKKQMADDGIEGLKNLRIRGKVQRESSWDEECYDGCGETFAGSTGNKALKSTKVYKFQKGTSIDKALKVNQKDDFFHKNPPPNMMSEIIPGTVRKIKKKEYGDVEDRSSTASANSKWNKQAPQFKANKGKFSKLKVKTNEGKTHKFRQNIFSGGESAFETGDIKWITKKDFKDAKKFDRQTNRGTEWKRYKKTGIPDYEQTRIYTARRKTD